MPPREHDLYMPGNMGHDGRARAYHRMLEPEPATNKRARAYLEKQKLTENLRGSKVDNPIVLDDG